MLGLFSPTGRDNLILRADSYKDCHFSVIPARVSGSNFYLEPRGGRYKKVVVATIQMILKAFFSRPITMEDVDEAEAFSLAHNGSFNRKGWELIVTKYGGYIPMEIKCLPEGTVALTSTPVMSIKSTDPELEWVPRYFETLILRCLWVGCTIATNSFYSRRQIEKYLSITEDDATAKALIQWMLHDFGARGVMDPIFTGAGHLIAGFQGSDNKEATYCVNNTYHAKMSSNSINATEHSVMTLLGRGGEFDVAESIIDEWGPQGRPFAMVLDSYDLDNMLINGICGRFKEKIIKYGQMGSKLVCRPDSGEPKEILPHVIKTLMNGFGYTTNSKGFDQLPSFIGTIQGDGVDYESLPQIMQACVDQKLATANYVFGSGGGLLQQFNRDTMKWAMKLSAAEVDGQWNETNKCPVTAPWKASKAGFVAPYWVHNGLDPITMTEDEYRLMDPQLQAHVAPAYVVAYYNGQILLDETLDTIRERLINYGGSLS